MIERVMVSGCNVLDWVDPSIHFEYVREAAADPGTHLLTWVEDGVSVSFGAGRRLTPNQGYIWLLGTRPSMRSKGFGAKVVLALESALVLDGARFSSLMVETINQRAVKLYESLGYQVAGTSRESWLVATLDGPAKYSAQCLMMRKLLRSAA